METTLSSKSRTVVIGPDRPVTIIGERINPTGRRKLAAEMAEGNFEQVKLDAMAQIEAGAHLLDVNAGIPMADEPELLAQTLRLVQSLTDVPLAIDSSVVAALSRGLEVYEGKALVNSVTAESERMEALLPLVKKHGAAVIALPMDENGIPDTADGRLQLAKKILQRAQDHGVPPEDVMIDPMVMPIGAAPGAGRTVLETLALVRQELGVNTVCGASNVSFGLPNRPGVNAFFLAMTVANGITALITNPLEPQNRLAVLAGNLLVGHDENCLAWIKAHRAPPNEGGTASAASITGG